MKFIGKLAYTRKVYPDSLSSREQTNSGNMSLYGCCFACISTGEVAIVERQGRFNRFLQDGCYCINPCLCEAVVGKVSRRVLQLDCSLETKTKDNVFVTVNVAVQYQVLPEKYYESFYILENPFASMRAYVYDTVRAQISGMILDDAFSAKDEISNHLKEHLSEVMKQFGYSIMQALVTELTPAITVRNAMNEINAAKRQKEASYQKAEGEKIIKVKAAEASAESMHLSGLGVAKQRKAIMFGLKESIQEFKAGGDSTTTAKDIMDLLVLNQYFDTLQEIGNGKSSKVVFVDRADSQRDALMQAIATK